MEQSISDESDESDLRSAVSVLLFGLSEVGRGDRRAIIADAFEVCTGALNRRLHTILRTAP